MQELDVLILGAGWTSTFLIPLLQAGKYNFAATTRDGRTVASHPTIKWTFDPSPPKDSPSQFSKLPLAKHILVSFPLTGEGQSSTLVHGYTSALRKPKEAIRFIQLGSTGIWQISQLTVWCNRHSPYDISNARAIAEDELLNLGGCVLNLSGLWGGERDPKNWVSRVAKTKEEVKKKTSVHLIHGEDVARAVIACMGKWKSCQSQRWMLTDGFVYDWWSLFAGWAETKGKEGEVSEQAKWVYELLQEEGVQGLPRSMETLGRCYDSREFWSTFKLAPLKARI